MFTATTRVAPNKGCFVERLAYDKSKKLSFQPYTKMIPVLVLTPAWLIGIFLQGWLNPPTIWLWVGAGGGLVLSLIALAYNQRQKTTTGYYLPTLVPLCLLMLCLGGLRLAWAAPASGPDGVLYYVGSDEMTLTGLVSAEPTYSGQSDSFRFSVQEIKLAQSDRPVAVSGEVYVRTATNQELNRGDLLQLTGRLLQPQELIGEDFPYRQWLARQGIYVTLSYPRVRLLATNQDFFLTRWFYTLNKDIKQTITRNVPGKEGDLLISILLGDKKYITLETRAEFTKSGVAHILAVSGSNISIMVMLITLALSRFFRRKTVLWVALGTIAFYVLLVGPSPSVLRAGLMGAMAIGGLLLGREYSGLLGLAGSAFLMTLWQPAVLMDIGFELSFMATLGLVILARPWQAKTRHWPMIFQEGIILTVAAELLTLPLVAFYFHQLSLVSVLTNLLTLPAVALIMATGGVAVVMGTIFGGWLPVPFIGQIFGGLAWLGLAYMLAAVKFCANLPFAFLDLTAFHPVWIFLYYGLLGLAVWWWRSGRTQPSARHFLQVATTRSGLVGATALTGAVWLAVWLVG